MRDMFDDVDGQSDTGSDLFATAIICVILLITVLITKTGGSKAKAQLPDIEADWLLIFSIAIQEGEKMSQESGNVSGELASGDKARDSDGSKAPYGKRQDVLEFEGKQGQLIEAKLISEKFDTYLFLYDSEDNIIKEDDDSGSGLDSKISVSLQKNGGYKFVVTSYHSDETGPYHLLAPGIQFANKGAQWDVPNSEVSRFDNKLVVHLWGSKERRIPVDRFFSERLKQVLGPLGELAVDRAPGLDSTDRHCLRLTFDSATLEPTLEPCNG